MRQPNRERSRESKRKERQQRVLSLVDTLTVLGECPFSELQRIAILKYGEDPAYVEHIIRPFIETGEFTKKQSDNGTWILVNNKVMDRQTTMGVAE